MVVLPEKHPLCRKSHVRLAELEHESFILCSADFEPSLHRCYLDLLKRAGFEPRILQEVIQLQTQLGLVAAGLGVSLVPSAATCLPRPGVVYREISGPAGHAAEVRRVGEGIHFTATGRVSRGLRQTAAYLHHSPLSVVTEVPLRA